MHELERTTEDGYPLYDVKDLRIGEGKGKEDAHCNLWDALLIKDIACRHSSMSL